VSATETVVPDLLRRFAPTPRYAKVLMKGLEIELHTDDVEIVATMQTRNGATTVAASRASLLARVIQTSPSFRRPL
jgi:hypothetical protein